MLGEPLVLRHARRSSACAFRGALRDGRDRDRPRADADRDAAQARRRRQVRRVLRRRPVGAVAARPRDDLQHVARVRRDRRDSSRSTPRRCATCEATGRGDVVELVEALHQGAGPVPRATATRRRPSASCSSSTSTAVEPSLAGPRRPQDRVAAAARRASATRSARAEPTARGAPRDPDAERGITATAVLEADVEVDHGSVVIAAITSCTNTSNPSVMVAAGLLARNAVERGLRVAAVGQDEPRARLARRHRLPRSAPGCWTPLDALRLQPRRLRLHDLHRQLRPAAGRGRRRRSHEHDLAVVAVLSGNRNFEGRIHPQVRASYLASPPLVVAYALAGTIDIDLDAASRSAPTATASPSTCATSGRAPEEVATAIDASVTPELYEQRVRARSGTATSAGARCDAPDGRRCSPGTPTRRTCASRRSSATSRPEPAPLTDIVRRARAWSCSATRSRPTTSRPPARSRATARPAATCIEHGVEPRDFNSLRLAPRQPRGDGARHVRQHPPAQRPRAGRRGRRDDAPAERRAACRSTTPPSATAPRACRWWCSPARSTAPARRATGRPRARCCWACAP